jgi:hypothetical protein
VFGLTVAGAVAWAALGQIDGAALVPVTVGVYWVALTRTWRIAVAAGLAGAAAIFATEGQLGPFGASTSSSSGAGLPCAQTRSPATTTPGSARRHTALAHRRV